MKTLVKKTMGLLMATLVAFGVTAGSTQAFAEVAEDFNSMKTGNTWIELEKANTDIFGDSKIAAVPKGVLKPEETKIPDAIKKIGGQDAVDQTQYFSYSTGIHSDDGKPALSPLLKMLKEYKPESATDDPAVPMTDNPMFYGDLSYNDDTTSKDVKISTGDNLSSLKLTLSNMNWLAQPIFSELSGHDMYRSEKTKGTLRFLTDSQLVYTIKFPKGFDISKATATSDASSDLLTLSTSVSGEVKTGMTLTVTLRRKGAGETFLTEDQFKNELNSLNTISVSMKDIAITKDAVEGKNVVTGSIGGFLEYMNVGGSTYDEVRQNKGLTWTYIHYFAAPQEANGKDSNLAANDSQYKIQYTFQVKKADAKEDQDREPRVLYRLYNPYTHEHFFTAETVENDNLVRLGWKSEGGVGYIYKHAEKGGVYRLYNPSTGEHHYTMNEDEVANCVKAGWKNEGVKWFSAQNKEVTLNKLYSMYNPYEKKFYHHYTADAKEIEQMVKAGWRKEEVKWCTLPVSYII